jgi:RNA polymerase sigma-54 factor
MGMDLLSRHQYTELGHLIGATTRQVEQIAHFIADNLNPFPARAFWGDIHQGKGQAPGVYSSPDLIISCLDGKPDSPFLIEIISPFAGMLRVNSLSRSAIDQAPEEKSEEWRGDLDKAELLVKCLQQRTNTMMRLSSRLAVLQREYILHGDEYLKPLTRAILATELELHESTISRAVAGKSVQLPNGRIIPMARFFDRSLHIRTALKQLIEQEHAPLSDTELVELLHRQGYKVARRTVAKYRAMEGILPSHLRQSHPGAIANE